MKNNELLQTLLSLSEIIDLDQKETRNFFNFIIEEDDLETFVSSHKMRIIKCQNKWYFSTARNSQIIKSSSLLDLIKNLNKLVEEDDQEDNQNYIYLFEEAPQEEPQEQEEITNIKFVRSLKDLYKDDVIVLEKE